ncbi:MAG TPA: cysteine desulfurase family protein [Patescibacteria group bacterium]|nr:cysteine desulfurase family protein [Patescibacteria group bacterium]
MKRIYLDNAATTPIDKHVAKAMRDFEVEFYGNPNSIHREGQTARAKIDFARAKIAKFINAKPQEIIFTSGATESNNHAIRGIISNALRNLRFPSGNKPHIVTTQLEHQSIYNTAKLMEEWGIVDVTYLKPAPEGTIRAEDVIKAITENTILISIIFVSNEIGSVLPIREIGKHLADVNARQRHKIYFHTDAVQAAKYFNLNVDKLGVDLMTLSAHKINGPKGIGALYIRTGTKLDNLLTGGSQEYGMRPGTQNTSGIIGFAKAVELMGSLEERQKSAEKIKILRDELIAAITGFTNVWLNGPAGPLRAPDNVNFSVLGADSDLMLSKLDLSGIAASTGSACVSGSSEPSHVIQALGKISKDKKAATVRLTLGKQNTRQEIKSAIQIITKILEESGSTDQTPRLR